MNLPDMIGKNDSANDRSGVNFLTISSGYEGEWRWEPGTNCAVVGRRTGGA